MKRIISETYKKELNLTCPPTNSKSDKFKLYTAKPSQTDIKRAQIINITKEDTLILSRNFMPEYLTCNPQ